jgi:hypothetical protein
MRLSSVVTALALLSGGDGLAHASQIITSPPLQTVENTAGACYIRNVGMNVHSMASVFVIQDGGEGMSSGCGRSSQV